MNVFGRSVVASQQLVFGNATAVASAGTLFFGANRGAGDATEDPNGSFVVPIAGSLTLLRVRIGGPCAAANTMDLAVRINGVDTALTAAWNDATGAGAQTLSDSATVPVAAGDRISISQIKVGTNGTNTRWAATVMFLPST